MWTTLLTVNFTLFCINSLHPQYTKPVYQICFVVILDSGSFSSVCRCSGEYVITECDLENGQNTVCCSNCTLSIRVLYNVLTDDTSDDYQEIANS